MTSVLYNLLDQISTATPLAWGLLAAFLAMTFTYKSVARQS